MAGSAAFDAYIAKQPDPQRAALEQMRDRIRALVPDAVESISYGMPVFKLDGRDLVWIAGWKAHCSIYPLTDSFIADHAAELAGYALGKGTLRFTPDAPPPDALIEDLVRGRVADLRGEAR